MAADSAGAMMPSVYSPVFPSFPTTVVPPPSRTLNVLADATCAHCGCMCDDITLTIERNRVASAEKACPLGEREFLRREASSAWLTHRADCFISGRPASLAEGYAAAARLLGEARYPLLYGLSQSVCEAQRKAVALADRLGATIDTANGPAPRAPFTMALQTVGASACTLGEIRNRSDFVLYWRGNPLETTPRHTSRYSLDPVGQFVPQGRAGRTCVVVDTRPTATVAAADWFLQIKPGSDFEALWTLRALARGLNLDAAATLRETGVALSDWQSLFDRMKASRYGAIFFDAGLGGEAGQPHQAMPASCEAILRLTRDLNSHTRFVARAIGGAGNEVGAENVLTWRTGYPFGVNLSRGYPRYCPGEYTGLDALERREPDAALLVGWHPQVELSAAAQSHLLSIPTIVLDARDTPWRRRAAVSFIVETFGVHTRGAVYRMDDVPLELRPVGVSQHPSEVEVLSGIESCLRESAGGL